ncbi:MAG: endonuclease [Candidatus Kerfeldbacteria bacterium CG08_land_8_20_14_0_20_40_16]|uniref:Probable endonuclease 4 n=1 Tax=Candidatus Kerfeldbacteria bacterium CG08_land_8_20_14_0_20_40_16 TaxID=2014244 RepID=A0A2H0YVU3_9BACT|nr:MAG: endonuclease [Candidatus Kerfeldbacteria bacterium CG08_land_8_20_14_0_20_40_16]
MQIGAHVSIAGGVDQAPINAHSAKCECFQFFSRSPRGGKAPELTEQLVKSFKDNCRKHKIPNSYIHTPYYINLASTNNRIRYGSIKVIREELERASTLGVKYVMSHLGSANNLSRKKAIIKVIEGIKKILDGYKGTSLFLIENSAGSGNIIGDQFEEINEIIKGVTLSARNKVGVCLDTCHAFSSGYDLRNKKAIDKTLKKFDAKIGLSKLKMIHGNDSMTEIDSHVDRHEHIGLGKIGKEGFQAILNHPKLKKLDLIIETPADGRQDDIKVLKGLRKK